MVRLHAVKSSKLLVVAAISQKGGSGKTTTALSLATAALEDKKRVLIVDLDPQASATTWFRARTIKSSLVVQPTHPAGLSDVLKTAREQGIDLVIVDTAAGTDATADQAVEVADVVIVTCRPSVMDLRAIPNSIRLCRVREKTPHVVLTQVEPQGTLQAEARSQLQNLNVHVMKTSLGRRAAFHHSAIDGRGACEYEPKGKSADETRKLYSEIAALVGKKSSQKVAG